MCLLFHHVSPDLQRKLAQRAVCVCRGGWEGISVNFSLRVTLYKNFVANYREITKKSTFYRTHRKLHGREG